MLTAMRRTKNAEIRFVMILQESMMQQKQQQKQAVQTVWITTATEKLIAQTRHAMGRAAAAQPSAETASN